MTREEAQARLDAFFEGTLAPEEAAALGDELARYDDLAAEFTLWNEMGEVGADEPGPGLSLRLAEMLSEFQREEAEQARPAQAELWFEQMLARFWPSQPAYSFAAAALCLAVGLGLGWFAGFRGEDPMLSALKQEVRDTRELAILTMLQQQNAEERLRGVSYSSGIREPNEVVLGALIRTLRYDTSVDVRLASLDSLARHRDHPAVRQAFLEAVHDASSPLLQVELVEQLARIADPQARQTLEELAVSTTVDVSVRQLAAQSLQQKL